MSNSNSHKKKKKDFWRSCYVASTVLGTDLYNNCETVMNLTSQRVKL